MKSPSPLVVQSSSSSLASPCRCIISMMTMILLSSSALVMSSSSFSTPPTTTRFGVGCHHHHRRRRHPCAITTRTSTRKISSHYSTTTNIPRLDRHLAFMITMTMMRGGGNGRGDNMEDADGAEKENGFAIADENDTTPSTSQVFHPSNFIDTTTAVTAATPPPVSSSSNNIIINNNNNNNKLGPNAPPPGYIRRLFPSFPWHELPNYLTYARCLSIPLFLGHAYYPSTCHNRAPNLGCIFAVASITDWFDGYLARRWDITSAFGAFLDPVADKLMVSTALLILSGRYGGLVAVPSAVILARELGVSALREWMASRGKRDNVRVGMQGKIKAALTMISLTCMLLVPEGVGLESVGWTRYFGRLGVGGLGNDVVVAVGEGGEAVVKNAGLAWMLGPSLLMLFASAIITVTSGSVYFRAALPVLLGKE